MPANLAYKDGDRTNPVAVTLPEFSAPFETVNVDYLLTQEFVCALTSYAPIAFDTPHPDYGDFLLVREDNKKDIGGGIVRWTRTYAKLPADFDGKPATQNFTFPQLGEIQDPANSRGDLLKTVTVRVHYEYFLCAIGQTYETPQEIPILPEFQPYLTALGPNYYAPYLYVSATTPTIATYEGWIAAGTEIIVQDSIVANWMGNIYYRETRYTKAQ